jgi:receptor tyrosine kinase
MSHEEVVKYLKEGKFLTCPDNTPKSAYRLMTLCWNGKSHERPPFKVLYRELEIIERELILIQRHFRSQKSILSESGMLTPQSPKSCA